MILKNLVLFASLFTTFGMVSFANASDYPITCASNDGGPRNQSCVAISNNTDQNNSALSVTCATNNGPYSWIISIDAGKQNQCLNLDSSCKIPRVFSSKKYKVKITVNNSTKSCNWPNET